MMLLALTSPAMAMELSGDAEMRLKTVGYRLGTANADRCTRPEMWTGIGFHDLGGYDEKDRPEVQQDHGLGRGFGVLDLVSKSAASRAGFRVGDVLVAIDGTDLASFRPDLITRRASYDRTGAFIDFLDNRLRTGPATVTIQREGSRMTLDLSGEPACGGQVVYIEKSSMNAWADGRYVAVTSRMMDLAGNDDELGFIVAHEMAHNILEHRKALAGVSPLLAEFGLGSAKVKRSEIAADELGVALMGAARMDMTAPARLLARARRYRPLDLSLSHPGISRRIAIVSDVAALAAPQHPNTAIILADSKVERQDQAGSNIVSRLVAKQ